MGLMRKTNVNANALLLGLQEQTMREMRKPHSMLGGAKSTEKKRSGEGTQQVTARGRDGLPGGCVSILKKPWIWGRSR